MVISEVDLSICRSRTDFGKGFYLANMVDTANAWAARRAMLSGGVPTVMRYELNEGMFSLYGNRFHSTPSKDWLEFISFNRKRKEKANAPENEPRHSFHWVSGPIANDDIADVIDEYLAGELSVEDAIRRARALPQTYQLSLHSQTAISYIDANSVSFKQFKNGRWTKDWIPNETRK